MGIEGAGERRAITPSHHYEDSDPSGRTAEGVTDDISGRQEGPTSSEDREMRIQGGIRKIMDDFGMRPIEVKGMQGFFVTELQKRGYLSETDMRFNPEGVVEDELRTIAEGKAA